jgi:hypothetical protein
MKTEEIKKGRLHVTEVNSKNKLVFGGIIKPSILAETAHTQIENNSRLIKRIGIGDF